MVEIGWAFLPIEKVETLLNKMSILDWQKKEVASIRNSLFFIEMYFGELYPTLFYSV